MVRSWSMPESGFASVGLCRGNRPLSEERGVRGSPGLDGPGVDSLEEEGGGGRRTGVIVMRIVHIRIEH